MVISIPTALSRREDKALQRYAANRMVVEAGALLGHSTIQLAQTAKRVVSIDRHSGYQYWPNDTLRMFKRNLDVSGVAKKVQWVVGDFSLMRNYPADFAFIDLCGTYANTLAAIRTARAPLIGIHDYERQGCRGVALACAASGYKIIERVDSLIILGASNG